MSRTSQTLRFSRPFASFAWSIPRGAIRTILLSTLCAWSPAATAANFTFTRIVDQNDPVPLSPGGFGNSFFFSVPAALSGDRVAFYGDDQTGNQGVYSATIGGAMTAVVDEFTQVPGQPVGSFFDAWDNRIIDISGSEIVYGARDSSEQSNVAIYKTDLVGNVSIVADHNTTVPNRPPFTEFTGFDPQPSIVDGVTVIRAPVWDGVSFVGMGVYQHAGGVLSELTFEGAGFVGGASYHPSTDGTSFAYVYTHLNSTIPSRLVRRDGAIEATIVTATDPIPGGDGEFNGSFSDFTSDFAIDGDNVFIRDQIHLSPTGSDFGVFLHDGATLQVIAREGDPIPGSTETFGVIHNYISMEGGHYAFAATTSTGFGYSLYSNLGGTLTPVLSVGDELDDGTVTNIEIRRGAVDGNRIAFLVSLTDGTSPRALYVAELAPTFLGADFDEDGDVDGDDFLAWQGGFGTTGGATHMQGDANADGNVDGDDFLIWQSQFGSGAASSPTAVVPEPSACVLLLLGMVAMPLRRKM